MPNDVGGPVRVDSRHPVAYRISGLELACVTDGGRGGVWLDVAAWCALYVTDLVLRVCDWSHGRPAFQVLGSLFCLAVGSVVGRGR